MEDFTCSRCGYKAGDLINRSAAAELVICRDCIELIHNKVYEQAFRTYPRLTRPMLIENHKHCARSFEDYFQAKIHDALNELSISGRGRQKKNLSAMIRYLPTALPREYGYGRVLQFVRGNKAIRDHIENGKDLYHIYLRAGECTYGILSQMLKLSFL